MNWRYVFAAALLCVAAISGSSSAAEGRWGHQAAKAGAAPLVHLARHEGGKAHPRDARPSEAKKRQAEKAHRDEGLSGARKKISRSRFGAPKKKAEPAPRRAATAPKHGAGKVKKGARRKAAADPDARRRGDGRRAKAGKGRRKAKAHAHNRHRVAPKYNRRLHGKRFRHRRRGFGHYHLGWWYAAPWWMDPYYSASYDEPYCLRAEDYCEYYWGWGTMLFDRCLRDHGCW